MSEKLTKAQRRELMEIAGRAYRSHYIDEYKPIVALLRLGYVERQTGKFGSSTYSITPAGRAAISREDGER